MEDLVPFLGETQPVSKLPWKIGAMESGRIALDSDDNKEVTGFIESEDAFYILGQQQTIERQAAQIEQMREALTDPFIYWFKNRMSARIRRAFSLISSKVNRAYFWTQWQTPSPPPPTKPLSSSPPR